jgi:hypothetical protein
MQDDVLEVMVTEYKVLREELYKIYDHQIRIFAIIVSALGLIYGIVIANENARNLILLIPIIFFPLGLRFQYTARGAVILSEYLKRLESQIEKKKEKSDWKGWVGFQNYYMSEKHSKLIDYIYDASARWLMFIVMPMGIAVWYSFTNNIVIFLGKIYLFLIIASPFVVWIINKLAEWETSSGEKRMYKVKIIKGTIISIFIISIIFLFYYIFCEPNLTSSIAFLSFSIALLSLYLGYISGRRMKAIANATFDEAIREIEDRRLTLQERYPILQKKVARMKKQKTGDKHELEDAIDEFAIYFQFSIWKCKTYLDRAMNFEEYLQSPDREKIVHHIDCLFFVLAPIKKSLNHTLHESYKGHIQNMYDTIKEFDEFHKDDIRKNRIDTNRSYLKDEGATDFQEPNW